MLTVADDIPLYYHGRLFVFQWLVTVLMHYRQEVQTNVIDCITLHHEAVTVVNHL